MHLNAFDCTFASAYPFLLLLLLLEFPPLTHLWHVVHEHDMTRHFSTTQSKFQCVCVCMVLLLRRAKALRTRRNLQTQKRHCRRLKKSFVCCVGDLTFTGRRRRLLVGCVPPPPPPPLSLYENCKNMAVLAKGGGAKVAKGSSLLQIDREMGGAAALLMAALMLLLLVSLPFCTCSRAPLFLAVCVVRSI